MRVLDSDTESNEILGESSLGAKVGRDGGVAVRKAKGRRKVSLGSG